MKKIVLFTALPLLVVSLAWGATLISNQQSQPDCMTTADVVRHQNLSRTGISLTCTEAIRRGNQAGGRHE